MHWSEEWFLTVGSSVGRLNALKLLRKQKEKNILLKENIRDTIDPEYHQVHYKLILKRKVLTFSK